MKVRYRVVFVDSLVDVQDDPEAVAQDEEADDPEEGVGLTILDLHLSSLAI